LLEYAKEKGPQVGCLRSSYLRRERKGNFESDVSGICLVWWEKCLGLHIIEKKSIETAKK